MKKTLVIYAREGCHLCEDAMAVIGTVCEGLTPQERPWVEVVDVDADVEAAALYTHDVPVIAVEGKIVFRHRVDPSRLEAVLRGRPESPTKRP